MTVSFTLLKVNGQTFVNLGVEISATHIGWG